ncbi:MAG: iron-containing alcohol dehydrogenase [Spirochaetes bacterium]|nr:iron-containing alcohol dehydrogenase [Spirochaetota bacterium]
MQDFEFQNSTKIIFGRGKEKEVGDVIAGTRDPSDGRVLFHYGGGSIKRVPQSKQGEKKSLYDRICASLDSAGIERVELGGVKPNPRLGLVKEGIEICREKKIGFILAVGGGSVIDSAKAIAAGVPYGGDVWDLYCGKKMEAALPIGVVLTIPAAGSESSNGSVITNEDGWYKRPAISELLRPRFAILNPELTFTLTHEQTMIGIADITAHLIERYFTTVSHVDVSDRLIEGTMLAVVENSYKLQKNSEDYDARAEIMWAATLAHNDLFSSGRIGDWASHNIEHELSGIYDVPHGAGLSVIIPAWMKHIVRKNPARTAGKLAQFAERVWNVEPAGTKPADQASVADEGIDRLKAYYHGLGLPTSLRELGVPSDRFEEMAKKATENGPQGNFFACDEEDIMEIFRFAEK